MEHTQRADQARQHLAIQLGKAAKKLYNGINELTDILDITNLWEEGSECFEEIQSGEAEVEECRRMFESWESLVFQD